MPLKVCMTDGSFCVLFKIFWRLITLLKVKYSLGLIILEISFLSSIVIKKAYARSACIEDVSACAGNFCIEVIYAEDNYGKSVCIESVYIKGHLFKLRMSEILVLEVLVMLGTQKYIYKFFESYKWSYLGLD